MVFLTCLICSQRLPIFMVAHQRDLKALASFNRVCHTGSSYQKSSSLYTGQDLQLLQFGDECVFVLLADIRAEFEEDCADHEISEHSDDGVTWDDLPMCTSVIVSEALKLQCVVSAWVLIKYRRQSLPSGAVRMLSAGSVAADAFRVYK